MKLVEPEFDIHCCWGFKLDAEVIFSYDVCIIVDVLSFSTSLDLLLHAKQNTENILASTNLIRKFSPKKLKITSPVGLPQQLKLHKKPVLVGCLRNARAVARIARQLGNTVLVIPMGDKLSEEEFKTCSEDFIAAGAIISYMKGVRSPESKAALDIYNTSKGDIEEMVKLSSSARHMTLKGFSTEVDQACQFNKSKHVPLLEKGTLIDLTVPEYSHTTTGV
jgi:2-phosphosulfolactate phosphatase